MHLTRNQAVFEVYNPYSIVQLSEVLNNLKILRGERTIYSGRAVVSNLVTTGLMIIVSATLVDPWSDLSNLCPGPELRNEVQGFVDDWNAANKQLMPAYQASVSNVRNFLEELSRWLDHGEIVAGVAAPGASPELVREFTEDVDSTVAPKLDELFGAFEEAARKVPEDEVAIHKAFARREIHPLTMCAPFIHRTYTKPLGFAGDYEMVRMILRDPMEGQNSYAKVVNSVLLRSGTAEAHRNRIVRLTEFLEGEARRVNALGRPFSVINIGCGPAADVERFLKTSWLSDQTKFHLLDFNRETLDFAQEQITHVIRERSRKTKVKFVHRSVHELLKQASARKTVPEKSFDMVYCAGLFDYLNNRICSRLLKLFYSWTLPGGLVVVTNVHPKHPVKGFLEHLQEWYLVLRNEKQMLALEPSLGAQKATTEDTGVNVFLEIRKPEEPRST